MRNIKNITKISSKKGLPSNNQGSDGDLSLNITNGGIGLFGKIGAKWYKFGSAQEISAQGKVNKKNKLLKQDLAIKSLDVDRTINIGRTAITTDPNRIYNTSNTDIDSLYISSAKFDVESSNTASKIYIGDISLQPTWGTTGSTIKLENGDNGADLKILGAGSTSGDNSGGDTVLSSGTKAPGGSGSHGSITLGAGDSGTTAATALNVNATSTVLSGTLTINTINTDTAGDNYLVEVSGVVKKRTPAEVLSDIGVTFGIADTNAVRIDGGDIASGEYARFTSNGLESRTLGEIKTDIGTGNSALVPSAGTSGHFLKHDGTFGQVAYSNLSGTPTIPSNYVTDDADDTMAGTLTIDKDSTATTSTTNYGQFISVSHTGDTAGGNTIINEGVHIEITNHTATHTGTHNMIGISSAVRSNTTGTSTVYGIYNAAQAGDTVYGIYNESTSAGTTGYGIYQKVDDGDTDYIQVSSANVADYFKMSTTANGATTLETVDADAALAHLTFQSDGRTIFEMASQDAQDDGWCIENNGHRQISFYTEGGAENALLIYESGTPGQDHCRISTQANGATTIATVDVAAAAGHLTLHPDGDIICNGDGLVIKDNGDVSTPASGYGTLYVNSDVLYFKTDGGTATNLLAGGGGSGLNSIVAAMVFG